MKLQTHLKIDRSLCGDVVELDKGQAKVVLETTPLMAADEEGLVHGGFTFGAADFAAMAAVNHPNVVLVGAQVKFLAPVVVGNVVEFIAKILEQEEKRAKVEVVGSVGEKEVFHGIFSTYTPSTHILRC